VHLLLSNDDGIDAPGLATLERALAGLGRITVVAPMKEHSAQSHAFTMHKPLRARPAGDGRFACSGTPADCVYLGLHGLLDHKPELVVSGINRGANLGYDVHYSGTAAAAREGVLGGVPSVAISLNVHGPDLAPEWETAAFAAREVVEQVVRDGLPPGVYLNVNVPNVPLAAIRGVRVVRMGARTYEPRVITRADPWGRPYHWIGGRHRGFDEDPHTDGRLCEDGFVVVSPLEADCTRTDALDALRARLERGG
jgi:5'-nucleotidase